MATPLQFAGLLLLSTALTAPAALAQTATPAPAADTPAVAEDAAPAQPEVSVPGGDIVVVGRRNANIQQNAPAVVSVLSSADIARTGEGNIAGALGRVTGLSVVGNGFVYVRGLGDRYSLALLNGSPLPSPEPLKRVVPLDLFPTNIVSSSLVQKSYSVNFPGEFGGGVINLTTNAVPRESFLTFSGGIGANTETTSYLGYVYQGSKSDWTGFDNGSRNTQPALAGFWKSGKQLTDLTAAQNAALAGQLFSPRFVTAQRWDHVAPNYTASVTGGTSFDLGGDLTLGVIATAGYSNKWQTRDSTQQYSVNSDIGQLTSDFERVTTDNRVVVNGLLGLGLEFGDNKLRWTNLYIRDTQKNTRMGLGRKDENPPLFMRQDTAWYERQLIDTQFVGEFKLTPELSVDVRGTYANSQREAPNEFTTEYVKTGSGPFGDQFINLLNNGANGTALIRYSDLNEDLWSGGVDVTYKPFDSLSLSAGYAYARTDRTSERREYAITAALSGTYEGVGLLRPDLLLSQNVITRPELGFRLQDNEPNPLFGAKLVNHAGYGKLSWQLTPELLIDGGVRYEKARQSVETIPVFSNNPSVFSNVIRKDYWLPAATVTWQFQPNMQLRANASQTIARPQFRELIFQPYFDPDTNRTYYGNPYLTDSKLFNTEVRYEWYFARDQRVSLAGFFKKIDKPIESFISIISGNFATSFGNAPKADLYGGEFEAQKYFDLSRWSDAAMFASRRLVLIGNYTYTQSKLKVGSGDTILVYPASIGSPSSAYFQDGAPLSGQSDHLVNLQLGMEDTDRLSQQTFILSYASKRVTSRGVNGGGPGLSQPDVYEYPGFNLDFVARQGFDIYGRMFDFKLEARNITGRKYREEQTNGTNTIIYNRYKPGTTINFSISTTF